MIVSVFNNVTVTEKEIFDKAAKRVVEVKIQTFN
mgnify:CR=1 FL=1